MSGSIVLSRLRRDIMILAVAEGQTARDVAEAAVREGRAAETWVVSFSDYFSESTIPWGNVDSPAPQPVERPASLAPLNPAAGEQESLDTPTDVTLTSPRNEQRLAAEKQSAELSIPDTGTNSQGEPTGSAHFSETNKDVLIDEQKAKAQAETKAK